MASAIRSPESAFVAIRRIRVVVRVWAADAVVVHVVALVAHVILVEDEVAELSSSWAPTEVSSVSQIGDGLEEWGVQQIGRA